MISLPVSYIIFFEEYHLVIFCLNKCNPKFITQLIFVCTNAIYDGYHTRYQHVTNTLPSATFCNELKIIVS